MTACDFWGALHLHQCRSAKISVPNSLELLARHTQVRLCLTRLFTARSLSSPNKSPALPELQDCYRTVTEAEHSNFPRFQVQNANLPFAKLKEYLVGGKQDGMSNIPLDEWSFDRKSKLLARLCVLAGQPLSGPETRLDRPRAVVCGTEF